MRSLNLVLTAGVAALLFTSAAVAQDAADFAEKFSASFSGSGFEVTLGAPVQSAGAVLEFDGATLTSAALAEITGEAEPLVIDTAITFTGVKALPDGGYTAERVSTSDIRIPATEGAMVISNIEGQGLYIPATPSPLTEIQQLQALSVGPISLDIAGQNVITVDKVTATSTFDAPQGSGNLDKIETETSIDGLKVDLSFITDTETVKVLEALNLQKFTGSFHQKLSWSLMTGDLKLSENRLSLDDIGSLDIALDIGGYTVSVLDGLQEIRAAAETHDTFVALAEHRELATKIAEKVTFKSFLLRFDNHGIVDSFLELAANDAGTSRDDFAKRIAPLAPFMLKDAMGDQLMQLVGEALTAFILNPKSLVVSISAGEQPVSLAQIVERLEQPERLLEVTKFSIKAND